MKVELKRLQKRDRSLLYYFRNLEEIIENSLSQRKVSWNEHQRWFSQVALSGYCLAFVIFADGVPAGHLRVEQDRKYFILGELSIYLLRRYRNEGVGASALEQGIDEVRREWPFLKSIHIRTVSARAMHFFEKNKFEVSIHGAKEECWRAIRQVD